MPSDRMEAITSGLATGKDPERTWTQACLLAFLNNKDRMDSSWGAGEVGALLKMRIDGCSWEQIQAALGPGHSIADLFYKHTEVCTMLEGAGYHPVLCAQSWAARYNLLNGFHIPFLTGGGWDENYRPELANNNMYDHSPYNDSGGLLSVGAPTAALRSHLVRTGRIPGGVNPIDPSRAQPQESTQGANGGPSGSNAPATGTSGQTSLEFEMIRGLFEDLSKVKFELRAIRSQLGDALDTNTFFQAYNTLLRRSLQESNTTLSKTTHKLRENTEKLDKTSSKLRRSSQLLSTYNTILLRATTSVHNSVGSGYHFVAEDSSDPNAPLPNPPQNGQDDDGLNQFRADATAMNQDHLQGRPGRHQGRTVPKPHPIETMYMAHVAAERWRHCPWSQGGTLPVPDSMPAPNLSVEEMVQLQKFVADYDTALRGGWEGFDVTSPQGHRAHGNKKAKRGRKTSVSIPTPYFFFSPFARPSSPPPSQQTGELPHPRSEYLD